MKEWQAATLPETLVEIIDSAVDARPQLIRRCDGRAVVVVSQEMFDETEPDKVWRNLRVDLLPARHADDHDELDDELVRHRLPMPV